MCAKRSLPDPYDYVKGERVRGLWRVPFVGYRRFTGRVVAHTPRGNLSIHFDKPFCNKAPCEGPHGKMCYFGYILSHAFERDELTVVYKEDAE